MAGCWSRGVIADPRREPSAALARCESTADPRREPSAGGSAGAAPSKLSSVHLASGRGIMQGEAVW